MYKNIISLGFFCSIAMDLEEYGFRNKSYPFDWLITDWEAVEYYLNNEFLNFFDKKFLSQRIENPNVFVNTLLGQKFYHDFDKKKNFDTQYDLVKDKYDRRIRNFLKDINEPTIFIRYIANQNELDYIEANLNKLSELVKQHNQNNIIIFIGNDDLIAKTLKIYLVAKDENDYVCRKPFEKLPQLVTFLNENFEKERKEKNLEFYHKKLASKPKSIKKFAYKVQRQITNKIVADKLISSTHSESKEKKIP